MLAENLHALKAGADSRKELECTDYRSTVTVLGMYVKKCSYVPAVLMLGRYEPDIDQTA